MSQDLKAEARFPAIARAVLLGRGTDMVSPFPHRRSLCQGPAVTNGYWEAAAELTSRHPCRSNLRTCRGSRIRRSAPQLRWGVSATSMSIGTHLQGTRAARQNAPPPGAHLSPVPLATCRTTTLRPCSPGAAEREPSRPSGIVPPLCPATPSEFAVLPYPFPPTVPGQGRPRRCRRQWPIDAGKAVAEVLAVLMHPHRHRNRSSGVSP